MDKKQKPLILEIDEAKTELAQCINKMAQQRKIPYYLIESIFVGFLPQIREFAKKELEMAKQQMNIKEEG